MVLIAIWKMEILRDYRRMYFKNGEDEKQICKQSDVYPPVHQIVPTLFPNDISASSNTANALPFGILLCKKKLAFSLLTIRVFFIYFFHIDYVKPITYDISDFKRRRPSLEESLKPSGNVKRKAGEVPFQSETEFNGRLMKLSKFSNYSLAIIFFILKIESKPEHPEDEVYFSNLNGTSPRLVN